MDSIYLEILGFESIIKNCRVTEECGPSFGHSIRKLGRFLNGTVKVKGSSDGLKKWIKSAWEVCIVVRDPQLFKEVNGVIGDSE